MLTGRGYHPFEFTSVMYRPIALGSVTSRPGPAARRLGADEHELYARVAAEGWRDSGYADFMLEIGRVSANTGGLHMFIAEVDGTAIAAGGRRCHERLLGFVAFAGGMPRAGAPVPAKERSWESLECELGLADRFGGIPPRQG